MLRVINIGDVSRMAMWKSFQGDLKYNFGSLDFTESEKTNKNYSQKIIFRENQKINNKVKVMKNKIINWRWEDENHL